MADLKLKRLKMRNWMKFRNVDMTFPEKGLVLVQGINTASGGALSSVGSGKTGLGESFSRALLGVTGRFSAMKQFSLDKNGDTYIRLEAEFLGKDLVVESGYACPEMPGSTGEGLRYTYDGATVERGLITQTREDLSKLLGVPKLLAEWTVFIDGEKLRFNKLTQSNCVDLVMSALRQPPWNDYFEAAKNKCGEFRREMAANQAAHQAALDRVNQSTRDVADAKEKLEEAERVFNTAKEEHAQKEKLIKQRLQKQRERASAIHADMAGIKKKLKVMEDERAKKSHEIEIALSQASEELDSLTLHDDIVTKQKDEATEKYTSTKTAYDDYCRAAANCPTCGKAMGTLDPARLEKLKLAMEKAKGIWETAAKAAKDKTDKTRALTEKCRNLRHEHSQYSKRSEVVVLSDDYSNLEADLDESKEQVRQLELTLAGSKQGPSDRAVVESRTVLKTCQKYLDSCREKLATVAEVLAEDDITIKILDYWYQAYSPYGIPNMVLREAIGPLNREARRVSAAMTGGTIDVRFSTTRELASGKEKAQLNIEVDNKLGDKELAGSSKGEAGLTNFIIAETLSEVGQISRRVGFRWYDEILPHQDPKVCQSIYSYMKDIAERLGVLVFLVDHNPVAANYADHVLLVEKESYVADTADDSTGIDENSRGNHVTSTVRWR